MTPCPQLLLGLCMVAAAWAETPGVVVIDGPLMDRILSSGGAAFIKFDTSPCARCTGLDAAWEALAAEFPGLVARVDCVQTPDVCAARHVVFDGEDPQPAMKFWTGSGFRRYTGPHELDYLRFYVQSKLAPPEASPTDGAPSTAPPRPLHDPRRTQRDDLRQAVWLLFLYASGLILFLVLVRRAVWYLRSPAEDPGWLLVVSSAGAPLVPSPTGYAPRGGDTGGGLFAFRVEPATALATPIAFHTSAHAALGHLCALLAPRALWLRGWLPCYILHAAAECCSPDGARAGGVVSLFLDARRAPCLRLIRTEAVGGDGAACVHVAAGPDGALACASDGSVTLLKPDLVPGHRLLHVLNRGQAAATGGLRREAVLPPAKPRAAGQSAPAGGVAAVQLPKPNAGFALVADELGKRLFLVQAGPAGGVGRRGALQATRTSSSSARHPQPTSSTSTAATPALAVSSWQGRRGARPQASC